MSSKPDVISPTILWAQRPELVLLTVPIQNATDVSIEIVQNGKVLRLDATADAPPRKYHFAVELFRDVSPEESRHVTNPRQIELTLKKKGPGAQADEDEIALSRAWPRLTKEKAKNALIQVDWSRWRDDEDEGAAGDDEGELGGNFGDMMTQMMMQQAHAGAEEAVGAPIPKFGEAAGQEPMAEEAIRNAKESDCAEDDFGDLPPLEE